MLIKVKVYPESHENLVVQKSPDSYEIFVKAGAQNNHANTLARYLLSKHLSLNVKMVSGGTKQNKIFKVFEEKK